MKRFLTVFAVLSLAVISSGCFKAQTVGTEEEPYNRSRKAGYENQLRYSVLAPFMYEGAFYAYYAVARKINGPDKDGFYNVQFKNGPKVGQLIKTKDVILKTVPAQASDLKKGLAVLVNHWDPKKHDENTPTDMWRKGVVYGLDRIKDGLVVIEFPHDKNDFLATKEAYRLDNIRLILSPKVKDPRVFLD